MHVSNLHSNGSSHHYVHGPNINSTLLITIWHTYSGTCLRMPYSPLGVLLFPMKLERSSFRVISLSTNYDNNDRKNVLFNVSDTSEHVIICSMKFIIVFAEQSSSLRWAHQRYTTTSIGVIYSCFVNKQRDTYLHCTPLINRVSVRACMGKHSTNCVWLSPSRLLLQIDRDGVRIRRVVLSLLLLHPVRPVFDAVF